MNLVNNVDIKNMFKHQVNKDFDEYDKYLNIFFLKQQKKDKYNRDFIEGKYILSEKENPNKKIIITPSKYIDINKLYIELSNYSNIILYKISNLIELKQNITEEHRNEFEELKNKFILNSNNRKDIDEINNNFYEEMKKIFEDKIDKLIHLAKFYQKRIESYRNINLMISEKLKNNLIIKFKNNKNKIPNNNEINKIAKENSVPSLEIEKWFEWIEVTYFYMTIKKDLNKIENEIKSKEEKFDINTKYMIIKKPIIEKK